METNSQTPKKLKLRERVLAFVVEHQERRLVVPAILAVLLIATLCLLSVIDRKQTEEFIVTAKAHSEAKNDEIRISFAGDIVLGRNVEKRAIDIGYDRLFQKMQDIWKDSDCVVANLDTCVIEGDVGNYEKLKERDVFIHTDRSNLSHLKSAGIDVLSLATGHIADYGRSTIKYAIEELDSLGIKHVGAGENREKAADYTIVEVKNENGTSVRLAIFGAMDHQADEFGAKAQRVTNTQQVDPNTPMTWEEVLAEMEKASNSASASDSVGSDATNSDDTTTDPWAETAGTFSGKNPILVENINNARAEADIIVVYMHWGDDKMFYATDEMRSLAHSYIDAGADLVVGTNPRVVLPAEVYKSNMKTGLIFYSIGTLVYDDAETRVRDSVSLDLVLDSDGSMYAEVTPLRVNSAVPEETTGFYSKRIFSSLTKGLDESQYSREENRIIISFGG